MAEIYKSQSGRRAIERQYRRALERWPVPREELVIPARRGSTFVVASGDPSAPPVVLLHGSGANSASWIRDVSVWSRQHRVYAVDVLGEPGLSAPVRPPLASTAYAEWLESVWDGLALTAASVVGVSLGGWLAVDFAAHHPDRVASLSLISPSGIGRQKRLVLLELAGLRLCGAWGIRTSLELVSGRAGPFPQPLIDALLVVFRNFRPRTDRIPLFTDDELARLTMPVQVILGSEDALLRSSETRERIERCVPRARVTVLENVGHVLTPQTTAVAEFLRTERAAPAHPPAAEGAKA